MRLAIKCVHTTHTSDTNTIKSRLTPIHHSSQRPSTCNGGNTANASIWYCHIPDPRNHCIEDSRIGIEEINEATGGEEDESKM